MSLTGLLKELKIDDPTLRAFAAGSDSAHRGPRVSCPNCGADLTGEFRAWLFDGCSYDMSGEIEVPCYACDPDGEVVVTVRYEMEPVVTSAEVVGVTE